MHRHALTDEQWSRLRRLLPKQRTGPESSLGDRLFVDAVLYRTRRLFDQASRHRGHESATAPHRANAGPASRTGRRRRAPWPRPRQSAHRRCRLRLETIHRGSTGQVNERHQLPQERAPRKPRLDHRLYRRRYLVEVIFHNVKRFRAVATRYEKTDRNYLALVQIACAWLWLMS